MIKNNNFINRRANKLKNNNSKKMKKEENNKNQKIYLNLLNKKNKEI